MSKLSTLLITSLSLLTHVAAQSMPCNGTKYLEVTLWDSFGDGWDDALWMMRDPNGNTFTDQSTCWDIEKKFEVQPCEHDPMRGGLYYMTVNTPDESLPEGWWEIYWKVEVFFNNGTSTGEYYEGVYNTTMVWNYNEVTDSWSLIHYDGIPDFECDGCSGSECAAKPPPKPKPKPKKSSGRKRKGPLKGKGHGDGGGGGSNSTDSEADTGSGSDNDSGSESSEMNYGPRAVDLQVKMYDQMDEFGVCNGWKDINIIGAHWYISDYSKTVLFEDGSLCDGCEGVCNICLGDGSYVFRVTGPTFNETNGVNRNIPYTAWEFCHARGFFNDQLNFHVKKGKCIPDDLRWADEICDAQENSTVTLSGMIALSGLSSEIFSTRDYNIVLDDLSKAVSGWNVNKMAITATTLDHRSLEVGKRALNTYTHDIDFTITFTAEDFGIDGATYAAVENLVSEMSSTLEASFNSGAFVTSLMHSARTANSELLGDVMFAELLSLEISKIAYAHTRLVYYYDDEESVSTSSSATSGQSNDIFFIIVAVGAMAFVAFVGIATHSYNGYTKVSSVTDSEHADMELDVIRSPFGTTMQSNRKKGLNAAFKSNL